MNFFQILKRPIITEKSLALSSGGKYTFEVDNKASKKEIAKAIESAFGVHVIDLKTVNLKGKKRRFGPKRKEITMQATKKAIAQLVEGEKIDLFTTGGETKGGA